MFPILQDKLNTESRELSGEQQQMVAIARGLMANPEVLLLDEPSLGLSPLLRQQLGENIKEINQAGTIRPISMGGYKPVSVCYTVGR
ncbi:ATP-binding cassette domain-containing protein [bacterium]|nr:ATP-binding cassette domain-containing protein [bacterium]